MDVLRILATLGAAVIVLGGPGLPAVLALRLRWISALAAVAPFSLALIAVAAEVGHRFEIPWTPLSPLLLGVLLGAVLWPLGRRRRAGAHTADAADTAPSADDHPADDHAAEDHPAPTRFETALATRRGRALTATAGLVIGGGTILATALRMMGSPFALSQTYDNVFHLNAIRHILRAGDGSAWVVGGMTALPGRASYYPAVWHQAVSLVVQWSGQEIILASNVVMLLVAAVVWPAGLMMLVRTCTPAGPLGVAAAGAFAGVSIAFPLALMSWGIILPYLLSLTMMPLVVMLAAHLAGLASGAALRPLQVVVLAPLVAGAVALAHPQGVFGALVLTAPVLLWGTLVHVVGMLTRRHGAAARFLLAAAFTAVAALVITQTWTRFTPAESSAVWPPTASPREAVGQALSLVANQAPTSLALGAVMGLAALAVLLLSRSRWLLAPFAAAAAMSVVARAEPVGDLRYLLTGNWYSDIHRIVALIAVAAIPVLAVGLDAALHRAATHLPALRGAAGAWVAGGVIAAVLAAALLLPGARASQDRFATDWQQPFLLTADERTLLEELPEVVPEDAVIATNAWNGSSLAYAISDRQVLNTFMGFQAPPEVHLLNAELDEAQEKPEVCEAAEELHVEYALDFGPQELHNRWATYTGLNEISTSGAAEVVLEKGDARLLRLLPCRTTDGSMSE